MKFPLILAWAALTLSLSATPKFGVVKVTDIYRGLPSTEAMQKKMQAQRAGIMENTRAERFRASLSEMEVLESQLRAIKDELDSENGRKLVRQYEIKRQEAETLRQAFEEFRVEEDKRINKEMVAATRASLDRISEVAQQLAKERNLDGVFDVSGNSNTGVPVLLYAADSEDLTEDVIALLDEKPAESESDTTESGATENAAETEPGEE